MTEPGSYNQYAKGKIVIWVRNDSKLDPNSGTQVLLDPSVKKIAIAPILYTLRIGKPPLPRYGTKI